METEYEQLVRAKRERQEARSNYSASLTDAEREEDGRRILEAWKKLPLKMKSRRPYEGSF
ncbi:hypothetical protein K3Z95_28225 [Pseudomonas aeruginosa]|uniref:hypothetical protein n=1 Tax=Pseudomonas aeruginosa group TaxID=136841 RepID=UPI000A4A649E|nr:MULTISPECIES: hypothetical protein [Pseudomonas aeruginosa group]MCR3812026.1 hypothetical protein [Pseudomonas aeruginosa]MCT9629265.1 hypothetical protein [Pseudomonas aeruginosa]MCW8036580.1 hypothetical protein [Pseudomonas aeruginosa]